MTFLRSGKSRLIQPLFSDAGGLKYAQSVNIPALLEIVRAYDQIWNFVYRPSDITEDQLLDNAHINLQSLGHVIETLLGEECFEEDPRQMTLDANLTGETPKTKE